MILVTEYHQKGSLFDYLNRPNTTLSTEVSFKLIKSALKGLLHLHSDIHTAQNNKPSIAHRDIKSKNILICGSDPNDLDISCVLADFGFAVTKEELIEEENNVRVGTKRYMSPEVLDLR